MPLGDIANGISEPPFSNVVHHLFRTSTSMFSTRRSPLFPNTGIINRKTFRLTVITLSIFQTNFTVYSSKTFLSDYKSKLLLRHSKIYFLKYRYLLDLQNGIFVIFNDNIVIFIEED